MNKSMYTQTRCATMVALALTVGLGGVAYASSDKGKEDDRRIASTATADTSPPQLALDDVMARLRTAGYSEFREIEWEDGRYEVKGLNAEGQRVELYVDGHTGEVVKEEWDD